MVNNGFSHLVVDPLSMLVKRFDTHAYKKEERVCLLDGLFLKWKLSQYIMVPVVFGEKSVTVRFEIMPTNTRKAVLGLNLLDQYGCSQENEDMQLFIGDKRYDFDDISHGIRFDCKSTLMDGNVRINPVTAALADAKE